jgi:ribonuclease D
MSQETFRLQPDLSADDLERLLAAPIVAMDCEMTGLHPQRDWLCLVQICDPDGHVNLIKNHHWVDAPRLKMLLTAPQVMKVFHYAVADCTFLFQAFRADVANVYCTKIASKIARTYTGSHGLASIVRELFGVELDKGAQSSDWLRDDLSEEQLRYAANDVIRLLDIKARLDDLLQRKGTLPSGMTYVDLNERCRQFIPTLAHLWINGWDFGREDGVSIFSH